MDLIYSTVLYYKRLKELDLFSFAKQLHTKIYWQCCHWFKKEYDYTHPSIWVIMMIANDYIIGRQEVLNKQQISTLNTQLLWILWNECIQCCNTDRLGFTKHRNMTSFVYHLTKSKKLNYRAFREHLLMKTAN